MLRALIGLNELSATVPSLLPDLPVAVSSFGAAVVGNHVFIYGGHSGRAHNYSTETTRGQLCRLDLKNPKQWEELHGGPKLQGLALLAHGGRLYRIGGMQPRNAKSEKSDARSLVACATFDPATGQWNDVVPLPEPRSSHDAVVVDDAIYVLGGWRLNGNGGKSEWLSHGLRLDLSNPESRWEKIDQPFQRRALTMAALDGNVYVVGGLNDVGKVVRTVSVFDTRSGVWTEGPAIPGEDGNGFTPASAVQCGRLFLTTADGKLIQLNEKRDTWIDIGQVKSKRFAARMVAGLEGRLVLIGGAAMGSSLASVEVIDNLK